MRVMRAVYNRAVEDGLAAEKQLFKTFTQGLTKPKKSSAATDHKGDKGIIYAFKSLTLCT